MLFEIFKGRLVEHFDDEVPGLALFMAGAGASTGAQFISYPFALIRTRMQAQGGLLGAEKYKGMWDAFAVTIRDEGMKGLFKVRERERERDVRVGGKEGVRVRVRIMRVRGRGAGKEEEEENFALVIVVPMSVLLMLYSIIILS